jgi:type I restriction enzyme S subunit
MAGLLEDLPADWRVVPFGDVVSDSAFGPRFSGDLYANDGNVATLRTTDMDDDGWISYETMPLAKLDTAKFQNHILRKDDLVITRSGTCGIAGIFRGFDKPVLPGAFLIRLRLNDQADVRFYRYFFNSKPGRGHLLSIAAGAVQQNINITNLEKLPVPLPPLPVQRRIAGILSAYDELIQHSQRRIRILESMARALYREWFVQFRFPGHEKLPCVASDLGDIPKGWEVKPLFDLAKVAYGKNLPTKNLVEDGPYPVYGAAKIIGRHTEFTREHRTIICGCRGSVGEMQITQPRCFVTNNSFTFDPTHPDNHLWLFHALKERGLHDVIGGAAQPQITLEGISSVELTTPPLPLRADFQRAVSAMFEQAWTLDSQIQNLRRTRDLLLPRLLSGQVALEAAE